MVTGRKVFSKPPGSLSRARNIIKFRVRRKREEQGLERRTRAHGREALESRDDH